MLCRSRRQTVAALTMGRRLVLEVNSHLRKCRTPRIRCPRTSCTCTTPAIRFRFINVLNRLTVVLPTRATIAHAAFRSQVRSNHHSPSEQVITWIQTWRSRLLQSLPRSEMLFRLLDNRLFRQCRKAMCRSCNHSLDARAGKMVQTIREWIPATDLLDLLLAPHPPHLHLCSNTPIGRPLKYPAKVVRRSTSLANLWTSAEALIRMVPTLPTPDPAQAIVAHRCP